MEQCVLYMNLPVNPKLTHIRSGTDVFTFRRGFDIQSRTIVIPDDFSVEVGTLRQSACIGNVPFVWVLLVRFLRSHVHLDVVHINSGSGSI